MKSFGRMIVVVTLLMVLGSPNYAEEAKMDPAMMEKMKMLTSPSEAHQTLEPLVGKWTYTGSFWMSPESPAQEMTGTAENSMIYGGRFLKQEVEGPWMGGTFNGLGFTGYDNIKGEYVSIWLDNASTGIMTVTGQYDPETMTLKLSGTHSCPLSGEKDRHSRSEWTVIDQDHCVYSSYMVMPGGKEFKSIEINYTRAQ